MTSSCRPRPSCRSVHDMDEVEAAEFLIEHLSSTKTNEEFFDLMKSGKL